MDALFQQELQACPFNKGGSSPISTSCYTLAAMEQLCRCLAKKSCRPWTHACIHVFLQPKAAYFMNTHLFVDMLSKITVGGKLSHTHLLKTTIKRTTLQRTKILPSPQLSTFLLHQRSWQLEKATKAAADPLSKDRQHPFNKDSHFQSHVLC
jgi:hypothetical protein